MISQTLWAKSEFRSTEYIVRNILLHGNERYTNRQIKRQLKLKAKSFWSSTTFTRRLLELDRLNLETFYIKNGYLYCSVTDSFSVQSNNEVDVFFSIKEGPQFYLKTIQVQGAKSIPKAKIIAMIDHKLNHPYNPIQVREGIKKIKREYANLGKPLATIVDSLQVNHDINLFLIINENQTLFVDNIKVVNNNKVKEKPIRREIIFKTGDPFSQEKLEISERHVYETGLFSSVRIRPVDIDTARQHLNLLVDVRELDMRYLGLNFGLGQDRGLTPGSEPYTSFDISGEWLNRNISGVGRRLSLKLQTALNLTVDNLLRPRTAAEIYYVEPWLLGFRSSTTFRLFIENQELREQSTTNYGGAISLIYQPDRRSYLETGVEIKGIRFSTLVANQSVNPLDQERALTMTLRRDQRDDFIFPKKGTLLSANGKLVGTFLGGTQDYYKLEASFSHYFTFWKPVTIAYRAKIGWMDTFRAGEATPAYEKFYLGGSNSLRGWPERKFLTDAKGYPLGSDIKVLTSAEIRFPLFWLLGGEIFIDGGNLVADFQELKAKQYRWNWGIGLTIATPLGPIRIDYAKKISPRGDEKENLNQVQFGIPYAF